ncbi:MAG: hypothetical protein ACRBDI_09130 [Alphaproteobacteria bacterium]
MTIDYNSAKHACNVLKRQIQNAYPELQIHFLLHEEGKRYQKYLKEKTQILGHPAGHNLCNHLDQPDQKALLLANRSRYACIAQKRKPGFLGFSKQNSFIGLCLLNTDRSETIEQITHNIRHLAWHAIDAYLNNKDNITIKNPQNIDTKRQNLHADIFASSLQILEGNAQAINNLLKDRIQKTITKEKGFYAEEFPFPICVDTLEFSIKNNIQQYKKEKNTINAAIKITNDVGKTFDDTSLEKWYSFSLPAQEMAWLNYSPEKILGAALYTSENTYTQSNADMVAEKLEIRPQTTASIPDYNPFANQEVNIRLHKKLCAEKYEKIAAKIKSCTDYNLLLHMAKKENEALFEKSSIGWCANGFVKAAEILQHETDETKYHEAMESARKEFEKEINELAWDTLENFSREIFYRKRIDNNITLENLCSIAQKDEEYGSIHYALTHTSSMPEDFELLPEHKIQTAHQIPQKTLTEV